jgi:hypothetical protein
MQKSNGANIISVTEQMYSVNRIHEMNKPRGIPATNGFFYGGGTTLGDPITDAIITIATKAIGFMKSIAGLFTKDPYRDIHIAAQNATVDGFGKVLAQLDARKVQGTLTQNDILNGATAILQINKQFVDLTNTLATKYPQDRSRYIAGQQEVNALAMQITGGSSATNLLQKYAGHYTASSGISSAINSITSMFTGGGSGGSVMPMVMMGAAFFLLPKLLKR